jgi:very-short-patch-repair endonuclease
VHVLNRARDARRCVFLEAQGLTVLVIPDTDEQPVDLAEVAQLLASYISVSLSLQADHAT